VKENTLFRRGVHPFPVQGLKQKTQKKKQQTYNLPCGRRVGRPRTQGIPPGAETIFRKTNQTKFPQDISQTEACRVVYLISQEKGLKVGNKTGKGWGQERGRMRMPGRPRS
jgi:hypothetical protein